MSSAFPDRDYVSPTLHIVRPDAHFPHLRPGDRWQHPWRYLRREVPHTWYVDDRHPLMGFLNRDEATLLHNLALPFAGLPALEIGAWLGWSTCHLALAGVQLDVVDPAHDIPEIRASVIQSLAACEVLSQVHLAGGSSPETVHALGAAGRQWALFFIDGDHEGAAPVRDVEACLPYAAPSCAFVLHDLASPAVAQALDVLKHHGFSVLVYQTAQVMAVAWRGDVQPVAHVPDPEVAWQVPHHLIGWPMSGLQTLPRDGAHIAPPTPVTGSSATRYPQLSSLVDAESPSAPCSVCIVSNEVVGPSKNGGIGTSMTGLAETLARAGHRVTILFTGSLWSPDVSMTKWINDFAARGIQLVSLSLEDMSAFAGPVQAHGFAAPACVYRYLRQRHFDVIHFNDCCGDGYVCLTAKRLGIAFEYTLLVVALHSPSQWVLEHEERMPTSLIMSAFQFAERASIACADVVWSPSRYMADWAFHHNFALPARTCIQPYCLPEPVRVATVTRGRTPPPRRIVFFGRLEERKGLHLFCNVIQRLHGTLAEHGVTVTFLGKIAQCAGVDSLTYLRRRTALWTCPVEMHTDLGQPEALAYLRQDGSLAVMASPVDNSPCTVYEVLAEGIPFLAARTGGIPELIAADDAPHVLFEYSADALTEALSRALDEGGWIATPAYVQADTERVWSAFHATPGRHLTPVPPATAVRPVVAIVDGRSADDFLRTFGSLAATGHCARAIAISRGHAVIPAAVDGLPVHTIDVATDDTGALAEVLAGLGDETVLLMHAGIRVRADALPAALIALSRGTADALQPSAVREFSRRHVPALGGDATFTLFESATFTGGLLVRGPALRHALAGRALSIHDEFMGLADYLVTRGLAIWPYPEPVFERPETWTSGSLRHLPRRVRALQEVSATDRYYALSVAYNAAIRTPTSAPHKRAALALFAMGMGPAVRVVFWVGRRVRAWQRRLGRRA